MAYTVEHLAESAAFDQLVAFQEASAHEVSHRRHHAENVAEQETTRFRDKVTQSRHQATDKGISH